MSPRMIVQGVGALLLVLGFVFLAISGGEKKFPWFVFAVGIVVLIGGFSDSIAAAWARRRERRRQKKEAKGNPATGVPTAATGSGPGIPGPQTDPWGDDDAQPPQRSTAPPPSAARTEPSASPDPVVASEPPVPPEPGSHLSLCPSCGTGLAFSPKQMREASNFSRKLEQGTQTGGIATVCECGLSASLHKTDAGGHRVHWWL